MKERMEHIISKNLQHYMEIKDIQQKDLAKKVGVSNSTVSYWIKGTQMPRTNKIHAICEMLHIEREQLLMPREESERAMKIKELTSIAKRLSDENLDSLIRISKTFEEV